ncbi:MAG: sigma-54-dependent Fis family transcriptional regulator [Pirellulales bacterium]|nr:sigma-54-dependent Fis family transcriptional regulator [Pirellulales bacterium]
MSDATAAIYTAANATGVEVLIAEEGRWISLAKVGAAGRPPHDLVAEALDSNAICRRNRWTALPLPVPLLPLGRATAAALLICDGNLTDAIGTSTASLLAATWQLAYGQSRSLSQLRRLEKILEISRNWYQARDVSELLKRIAQAATELLHADRASIFLWDKTTHTLVGRPALGIETGELRIPDHSGVVGQVLKTGKPSAVNMAEKIDPVNRDVDRQTGYNTVTLLCVPLTSASGERFGVFEVLNKQDGPFTKEDEDGLVELANHAVVALQRTQQFESLVHRHRQLIDEQAAGIQLIGACDAIEALRSTIRRVANTDLAVLVLGENGTGKEVVAQMIHYLSSRRNEPFVAVNCAALAETLLESELFGHERGAFTDAHEARPGKFELAAGGTLFLDEIGDMSPSGQAKLLRVLEEKTIVRVGGSTPIPTEARIIAATNQDLAANVRAKQFRQDLFFRLNVVTLEMPPLRERDDDVQLLADHFLVIFSHKMGRKVPHLTASARKKLAIHSWPGNVRELRNVIERLVYLSSGSKIDAEDLGLALGSHSTAPALLDSDQTLGDATRQFQIEFIRHTIDQTRGNMTEAAERLGLHRSNLYRKMRQLDMEEQ